MADIAREAGVAVQSVYTAGRSKADLLNSAVARAVAGDDQEVLVHDRPGFAAMAAERNPVRQVHTMAEMICLIQERSSGCSGHSGRRPHPTHRWPTVWDAAHRLRLETFRAIIGILPEAQLRSTPEASTDTVWAVASAEVFLLLRRVLGWSWPEIRSWLSGLLVDVLLVHQPPDVSQGAGSPH